MPKRSSKSRKTPAPSPSTKQAAKPFPYRALVPGGSRADLKPGIPVVIHGPNGHIPMYGLIDSGADDALLPLGIAAGLGIDLTKCRRKTCATAGGPANVYVWPDNIEIEVQQMGGMRVSAPCRFSDGLPVVLMLLGRNDFFSAFRVSIDERAKSFTLDPYD
jgi:hypothetical protein